ncbi:hypothetical protein M8J76_001208 [Diaphorina citri]|nr:hypothetical protein M8J76_001208 [Diaphorina citri]
MDVIFQCPLSKLIERTINISLTDLNKTAASKIKNSNDHDQPPQWRQYLKKVKEEEEEDEEKKEEEEKKGEDEDDERGGG